MITLITLYNHHTQQYYARLHTGVLSDNEKVALLKDHQAANAAEYSYSDQPVGVNRLYFQEFDGPDSGGVYFNINGDRQIYDLLQNVVYPLDYHI
jgi:hypothetical protein